MDDSLKLHVVMQGLLHLAECTLATVEELKSRTRPPKHELARQTRMAQSAIDALRNAEVTGDGIPARYGPYSRVRKALKRSPLEQLAEAAE